MRLTETQQPSHVDKEGPRSDAVNKGMQATSVMFRIHFCPQVSQYLLPDREFIEEHDSCFAYKRVVIARIFNFTLKLICNKITKNSTTSLPPTTVCWQSYGV